MLDNFAHICIGILIWAALLLCIWLLRPSSSCMRTPISRIGRGAKAIICLVMAVEIALCSFSMALDSAYNGDDSGYRRQYELIADSFLNGKLYFEYDADPLLEELDNPYDPDERKAAGVSDHWDHAYYDGHFYMYFGVVPALLVFVPWKVLVGTPLETYHATQLFTALIVIGFFFLFYRLARRHFPHMPAGTYTALSVALSGASIWLFAAAPALYCTAISAGVCAMVWCFTLFLVAFDSETAFGKTIACTVAGAVCGALAFGCRPPIALGNIVVIAMLVAYLRTNRLSKRKLIALFVAGLVPYIAVAIGLGAYNYARFGSVLEFGQAYQLTIADQHDYGFTLDRVDVIGGIPAFFRALFDPARLTGSFPYVKPAGVFWMLPILLVGCLLFFHKDVRGGLRRHRVLGAFAKSLPVVALIVVVLDLFMSPMWIYRYNLDVNWMFALAGFVSYGILCETVTDKTRARIGSVAALFALATVVSCVLFFLMPYDYSFGWKHPEALQEIASIVTFGFGS